MAAPPYVSGPCAASSTLPVEVACAGQRVPMLGEVPIRWSPWTSSRISVSSPSSTSMLEVSPVARVSASISGRAAPATLLARCARAPSSIAAGPRRYVPVGSCLNTRPWSSSAASSRKAVGLLSFSSRERSARLHSGRASVKARKSLSARTTACVPASGRPDTGLEWRFTVPPMFEHRPRVSRRGRDRRRCFVWIRSRPAPSSPTGSGAGG